MHVCVSHDLEVAGCTTVSYICCVLLCLRWWHLQYSKHPTLIRIETMVTNRTAASKKKQKSVSKPTKQALHDVSSKIFNCKIMTLNQACTLHVTHSLAGVLDLQHLSSSREGL